MLIDVSLVREREPHMVSVAVTVDVPEGFGLSDRSVATSFEGSFAGDFDRFTLEGRLTAEITVLCALCLTEIKYGVGCDVSEVFAVTRTDIDDWPVTDNSVDITPVLLSNLLTALPQKLVCREDCKGLCRVCGQDLNDGECGCERGKPVNSLKIDEREV